jgi:hypothetical protein
VARHWATGSDDSQLKADAEGFGIPVDAKPSEECVVWEENWDAVTIFLLVDTQWRVAGMGVYMGLDYGVVFNMMELYSISDRQGTLEGLRVIEREALALLNKSD